jgi:hypothetical protein
MKINETESNIVPLILQLIGENTRMDSDFMNTFKGLLELRGFHIENQEELEDCIDAFVGLGLVEIYTNEENKYMIRKTNG